MASRIGTPTRWPRGGRPPATLRPGPSRWWRRPWRSGEFEGGRAIEFGLGAAQFSAASRIAWLRAGRDSRPDAALASRRPRPAPPSAPSAAPGARCRRAGRSHADPLLLLAGLVLLPGRADRLARADLGRAAFPPGAVALGPVGRRGPATWITVVRSAALARRNASSSSPMPETVIPIAPMASACLAKSTRTSSPTWRVSAELVVEGRDALGPLQPVDHGEAAIVADHDDQLHARSAPSCRCRCSSTGSCRRRP